MKRCIAGVLAAVLCFPLWGCGGPAVGQSDGTQSGASTTETKREPSTTEAMCQHTYGDWAVKTQATCAEEGREERVCTICNKTESRSIAKKDHTFKAFQVCKKCMYVDFDPDADFVELGVISDKWFGEGSAANHAWDIKVWNGQVFRGAGDYDKNSGAAPILAFDIASQSWKSYDTVPDQAVHSFEEIGGTLYAPGIDPTGGWSMGNFYVLKDGKWEVKRNIPNGVHNFDMIEFDGKIFAGVGTENINENVAVSSDGGETFTYVPLYKDGKPFDVTPYNLSRTYEFVQYNGQLYALMVFREGKSLEYIVFRYEDGKMVYLSNQVQALYGGARINRKYWPGQFEFGGACYLTAGSLYAIRDFAKPETYEKIGLPNDEKVADALLKDGVIYVLGFSQNQENGEYTIVIYKSTTGKTGSFEQVRSFTYPAAPCSFDTDGTYFYIGMGTSTVDKTRIGMVLRVKPAA